MIRNIGIIYIIHLWTILNVQSSQYTVLNIEELNSIHYNIDIGSNPVLKHQEWNSETITVTNKHGQEYICKLPKVEFSENENKKDEDILDQLVDISELLKPMEAAPCLIKKKDWWTYEFCYGSVIKQYHLEDNRVTGTILVLGKYESEYNWRNSSETKNKLQKFHSQFYVNGTRCDITAEPRRTEVRFHCEEGAGDYIQQVDEPESCRYIVTIATTRVCHHPYLKSSFNKSPHSITCAPALDQHQFEKYQQLDALKRKLKDSKRLEGTGEEEPEEDKWSIRFLTLPSKKSQVIKDEAKTPEVSETQPVDPDRIDTPLVPKEEEQVVTEAQDLGDVESVSVSEEDKNLEAEVDEDKNLEAEVDELMTDLGKDSIWSEEEASKFLFHKKPRESSSFDQRIKSLRQKVNSLFFKWIQLQENNQVREYLENSMSTIDQSFDRLQSASSNMPEDLLPEYFEQIAARMKESIEEIVDKNGEKVLASKDMELLSESIHKASKELLKAENRMKALEKLLDTQLSEEEDHAPFSQQDGVDAPLDPQVPLTSSPTKPPTQDEDSIEENEEVETQDKELVVDKTKADTSHVRILNERSLDESRKAKLEQSIKERLQKADSFGRKIEVKILTPNYLEEEDKDAFASFSQEDSEAFHNAIVNILSASAEEMQERERQSNLESNYNFQMDEVLSEAEVLSRQSADSDPQEEADESKIPESEDTQDVSD